MKMRVATGKYRDYVIAEVTKELKPLGKMNSTPTYKDVLVNDELIIKAKEMNALRYGVCDRYKCKSKRTVSFDFMFGIETEDKYYLVTPKLWWVAEK